MGGSRRGVRRRRRRSARGRGDRRPRPRCSRSASAWRRVERAAVGQEPAAASRPSALVDRPAVRRVGAAHRSRADRAGSGRRSGGRAGRCASCRSSIASSSAAPVDAAAVESRSDGLDVVDGVERPPGSGSSAQRRGGPRAAARRTARGNRSCSSRKRTTAEPSIGPRTARWYICSPDTRAQHAHPLHLVVRRRRRAGSASGDRTRPPAHRGPGSSCRPVRSPGRGATDSYASSRFIVVASTPSMRRPSAMTRVRKRARLRRSTPRSASRRHVQVAGR